jgi:N-acetylmuramoyl-L-alanine amidase
MPFNEKFTITARYLPKPSKRRSGLIAAPIRFLVAHDTGNRNSTAWENVAWYTRSKDEEHASAHIFVDDKQIIECVPALTGTPEKAWHVLYNVTKDNELYGVNANDAAIGIEYCFGDAIDAGLAYEKYLWVLARCCFTFGLDPSRDIVGHFILDPKRKTDPVTGLAQSRRTYEKLLRDIIREYNDCMGNGGDVGCNGKPGQ